MMIQIDVKPFKKPVIDPQKVLDGLKCCSGDGKCLECPYNADPDSDDYSGCYQMHQDAYLLVQRLMGVNV
jgi:hypothetical protein